MFVPILAPLATLAFLVTLWLLVMLGAAALEESGGKIAAALKGRPASPPLSISVLHRRAIGRARLPAPVRLQWRAAA
jgi:hypothetical protein